MKPAMTEIGSYGKFLDVYRYDSYPDFTQEVELVISRA